MRQRKGKDHIAFIVKVADDILAENDFNIPFEVCITEALNRHRERLIRLVKIDNESRKTDPYYSRNKFKDTSEIPTPPRIGIPTRSIPSPIPMSALND